NVAAICGQITTAFCCLGQRTKSIGACQAQRENCGIRSCCGLESCPRTVGTRSFLLSIDGGRRRRGAAMSDFYQSPPVLSNQYRDDGLLRSYLACTAPAGVLAAIEPELAALGERAAGEWLVLAERAEADPPRLVHYDAWGRR